MINVFTNEMSRDDHCYDPLRFIASSYFVKTWMYFTQEPFSVEQISRLQTAARTCVDEMMQGEDIYWNIDFSEKTTSRIWTIFERAIQALPINQGTAIRSFCRQLLVSKSEIDGAEYLISVMNRLRNDSVLHKQRRRQVR